MKRCVARLVLAAAWSAGATGYIGAGAANAASSDAAKSAATAATAVSAHAIVAATSPPGITKSFGAASILLNATTSLTFNLTNPNGALALNGVAFTDALPFGLVIATPSGSSSDCGGTLTASAGSGVVSLTGGTLAAGGACTISLNVQGNATGVQNNTTSPASATESGAGATSNTASITVIGPPSIAKAFGAASINLNATTTLSLTITNPNATVALNGVGFGDTLPGGLVIANPNGLTGSCGAGTITTGTVSGFSVVNLAAGAIAPGGSCTFSVNVVGTSGGHKVNTTGSVTSSNAGSGNQATASIDVLAPDPSITKTHAGILTPGQTGAQFTLTVSNVGFGPTLGTVTVTDTLPNVANTLVPTAISGTGWTCTLGTLTCTRADPLPSGSSYPPVTLTVNIPISIQLPFSNTATVSGGGDINPNNNTASDQVGVSAPAITKAFAAPTIALGGTTTLNLTLTNPNPTVALTNVAFTDNFPAGLVVASTPNLVSSCVGTAAITSGSITLAGATLAASGSCSVSVDVQGTTAGVEDNSVQVTSGNGGTGNTSSASITVIAPATVAKAFGAATLPLGGTASLTVTLSNPNSASALAGLSFTDNLPAGMVVAAAPNLGNTCGGTATTTAGATSLALTGGALAAATSCSVSVDVQVTAAGAAVNSVSVDSTNGGSSSVASASIAAIVPPTISKAFGSASIVLGATTSLSFTVANPNTGSALSGLAFSDTLPAGLRVATPNGLAGACGGGAISAGAGGSAIGLAGATLAAGASCTFAVNVIGMAAGNQVNVTGFVASAEGGSGGTATASVFVAAPATEPAPMLRSGLLLLLIVLVLAAASAMFARRQGR